MKVIILKVEIIQENSTIISFAIEDTGIGINLYKLENLRQKLLKDVDENEFQLNTSGSCLGLTVTQKLSVLLGKTDLKIESALNIGDKSAFYNIRSKRY